MTTEFSEKVLREASDWFARLSSDDATARDHVNLADWLSARPEHQATYDFVTETCRLAVHVEGRQGSRARRDILSISRKIAVGGAMALAATIIGGVAILTLSQHAVKQYQTAIGEIRTLTLDDGSVVTLNGATALNVSFTAHTRDLELKSGEFFITVGKDPARPFRVHAGGRVIEDVGTAFDVDTNGRNVDVSVGEGTIVVSQPAGDSITLSKGEALTYTPEQILGAPRPVMAEEVGTWRVGILSYDQVPLEWLVADLNRQFDGGIAVPDPKLAAMQVTLTLKLHDRDATVGTLEKLLPVRAVAHGKGAIELVSAKP